VISIVLSVLALTVSATTAWLTLFHRGTIRMTAPSMVVFAYDGEGAPGHLDPKVMVRTLLFSTGAQGHAVETLFLRLRHGGSEHLFPVWGIATAGDDLDRGGGLFVGKSGVAGWHYLVSSGATRGFKFTAGEYDVAVLARTIGRKKAVMLWSEYVTLPDAASPTRHDGVDQVWFDRDPDSGTYFPRLESRAPANQKAFDPAAAIGRRRSR
jgi:hypothetical protein